MHRSKHTPTEGSVAQTLAPADVVAPGGMTMVIWYRPADPLNHPHILAVFEAGEIGDRQYLVSEYVDAGTLRTWIQAPKPSWRQIVNLLIGVADGRFPELF